MKTVMKRETQVNKLIKNPRVAQVSWLVYCTEVLGHCLRMRLFWQLQVPLTSQCLFQGHGEDIIRRRNEGIGILFLGVGLAKIANNIAEGGYGSGHETCTKCLSYPISNFPKRFFFVHMSASHFL